MNEKKELVIKQQFQQGQLPAIAARQSPDSASGNREEDPVAILRWSARDFKGLLAALEQSGRFRMSKIHDFNRLLASCGDKSDLTPKEMLCALTLLAKYVVMHSAFSGGVRVNHDLGLLLDLPNVIDRLVREGKILDGEKR